MKPVCVPVHQDIDSILNSGIDNRTCTSFSEIRVFEIILHLTFVIIDFHAYRGTDQFCIPVLNHMLYSRGVIESWPEDIPAEAHTLQLNCISGLIHQGCTLDMQTLDCTDPAATAGKKDDNCSNGQISFHITLPLVQHDGPPGQPGFPSFSWL